MAVKECRRKFLSNATLFYPYNIMMALTNGRKLYKQNMSVSVGLSISV